MTVTCTVSTKDRYNTTLPLTLMSVAMQTRVPERLVIFDDGEQRDLRDDPTYSMIFNSFKYRGIDWSVALTGRRGQVYNHQLALENEKTDFIWRLDDDNVAEAHVLEVLLNTAKEYSYIGAVGGLVHHPNEPVAELPSYFNGSLEMLNVPPYNVQWCSFPKGITHPKQVAHLYSTFMYSREAGLRIGFRPEDLSPVGHREETLFTNRMYRMGYALMVNPNALTLHLRAPNGGIRSHNANPEFWNKDEENFQRYIERECIRFKTHKVIVMDNGIGDHLMLLKLIQENKLNLNYDVVVLAASHPEAFDVAPLPKNVHIISIDQAGRIYGDLNKYNVYIWAKDRGWKGHLRDAFVEMINS